jgi:hypothetical protein
MKKLVILAALLVIGVEIYQAMRPIETIVEAHVVRAGDTMYNICDRYYIVKNNSECFNEMWDRNMDENGNKRILDIGDIVWITNRVYAK